MFPRTFCALSVIAALGLVDGARAGSRSGGSDAQTRSLDAVRAAIADPSGPTLIQLEAGLYRGDLVIRRPLVLRGNKDVILEGSGAGTVLSIESNDVVVEGLAVRRSGRRNTTEDAGIKAKGERVRIADVGVSNTLFGVLLYECKDCVLERASIVGSDEDPELRGDGIKLWESHGSTVRDSTVTRARDIVVWYTRRATIERNTVRESRYGGHFMYASDATVRKNRLERNIVGLFVMYSRRLVIERNVMAGARGPAGVGLGFKDSDAIDVRGNWLVANTTGAYLDNTPRTPAEPVTFEGNVFGLNEVALRLHSSEEGLTLRGNDFRENPKLIEIDGGGNALRVATRGNRFSDYEGYDLDGDGVGDVPHEVKALSSDLVENRPSLRFFHGTASFGIIDALARAMPIFATRKLLVDPTPLVRDPHVEMP